MNECLITGYRPTPAQAPGASAREETKIPLSVGPRYSVASHSWKDITSSAAWLGCFISVTRLDYFEMVAWRLVVVVVSLVEIVVLALESAPDEDALLVLPPK